MKKTFTINIGGIIFHIDDDAYTKLNEYMASIKKHFNNLEGRDEIIADIENRIAEILQSKLSKTKEVIVLEDINDVIERMGEPSDFIEEEMEEEPQRHYRQEGYKRLYRDSEDKMVGGVASGIAAYFSIDPIWVRLIFVISIFTTLGAFVYLILWVALPEAVTAAEKLEMKGEKVTISNIEKSVKEEFENIKERFSDIGDQAKETLKKTEPHAKNVFENILAAFITISQFFLKGLLVFIGVLFLIIGFSFVIGFIGALFGIGGISVNNDGITVFPLAEFLNFFLSATGNIGLFKVGLFFFFGVPVLMLIYHGIRLIIGFDRIKQLGSSAFLLWVIGLIFTLVFAFKVSQNFKYEVMDTEKLSIEQPSSDFIYLNQTELNGSDRIEYDEIIEIDDLEIAITDNTYYLNQTRLEIVESHTNKIELIRYASARGRTGKSAKRKAEDIVYHFNQDDNVFNFDLFYGIPKDLPWSDQELDLELRIPVGTKIKLDRGMYQLLRNRRSGYYKYWSDDVYLMTENGLEAIDDDELKDIGRNESKRNRIKRKKESTNQLSKLNSVFVNILNTYSR